MKTNSNPTFIERRGLNVLVPFLCIGVLAAAAAVIGIAFGAHLQSATATGGFSAPALFNRANAEARAGKTALAVVDYERAKFLAPNDANITANLQAVRDRAGLPSTAESRLQKVVSWASPNFWALLGSAGLVFVGTGVLARACVPRRRSLGTLAAAAGAIMLVLCGLSSVASWQDARKVVVLAAGTPARISPTTVSEVAFKLREGELAKISGRYGDFVLVRDVAGRAGWVSQKDLTPVIPE
jgi:hypothetical protein